MGLSRGHSTELLSDKEKAAKEILSEIGVVFRFSALDGVVVTYNLKVGRDIIATSANSYSNLLESLQENLRATIETLEKNSNR